VLHEVDMPPMNAREIHNGVLLFTFIQIHAEDYSGICFREVGKMKISITTF
jgi:hypothetical protein